MVAAHAAQTNVAPDPAEGGRTSPSGKVDSDHGPATAIVTLSREIGPDWNAQRDVFQAEFLRRSAQLRENFRTSLAREWIREMQISAVRDIVEEELQRAFDSDYVRAR
jgi:hypothetical protein